MKAGKIYHPEKIQWALHNFFRTENILQLRELVLKEVAFRVEKKVEHEVGFGDKGIHHEKFLGCISSNERILHHIIRKVARLACRYNTIFLCTLRRHTNIRALFQSVHRNIMVILQQSEQHTFIIVFL